MIGIYKITSPDNNIYIGQSVNIKRRFKEYELLINCKFQNKLYTSFITFGPKNHKFETVEICDIKELNEKERHYQDLFNCIGLNGLNCRLTTTKDKSGYMSQETKDKISKSNTGKPRKKGFKNEKTKERQRLRELLKILTCKRKTKFEVLEEKRVNSIH